MEFLGNGKEGKAYLVFRWYFLKEEICHVLEINHITSKLKSLAKCELGQKKLKWVVHVIQT